MKLLLLVGLLLPALAAQDAAPPVATSAIVGLWQPADKRGVLRIYEHNGRFYGQVAGPKAPPRLDAHNPDPKLRSRPLLGVVILQDFRFDGHDAWTGGHVYDPESGHTYACTMRLRDANTLLVRGYIGVSLLGRTVVWSRLP